MVHELRKDGKGLREHEFEGGKLHQKIAHYETGGEKEVWELFLKKGFYCDWDEFLPEYHVLHVTDGKIHCSVRTSISDNLEFDAVEDNIVFIPPWTPFKYEVVKDVRLYDLDCAAMLEGLCEEIEAYMDKNPDVRIDEKKVLELGKEFELNFNVTDFGFKTNH